jgi:prevent-host-death family protein
MKTLTASYFKAHCFALLDEVAETSESLLITKNGGPIACVSPARTLTSLHVSVTFAVSDEDLVAPEGRW